MKEIIHLQVGQYGNTVGLKYWEILLEEHGISPTGSYEGHSASQLTHIDSYFNETTSKHGVCYIPRALMVDLDSGMVDWCRASNIGCFRPDNFFAGTCPTANCWAEGYYEEGRQLEPSIMDAVRRETERCDSLQGFQIVHGLGGGTGSGLGTLLVHQLRDAYPEVINTTFSLFPSPTSYGSVVEPYNAILALNQVIEFADGCVCMDDGILMRRIDDMPSFARMSKLGAMTIAGITSAYRFPAQLDSNMRKLYTNMIPYPRMHFFVPGISLPTHSMDLFSYIPYTFPSLVQQLFDAKNLMLTCEPYRGRSFTLTSMFCGSLTAQEVQSKMAELKDANSANFIEWIPNSINSTLCEGPPRPQLAATYISNTSSVTQVFHTLAAEFEVMFRRKAYLSSFRRTAMEELEMHEALSNVRDLISEYVLRELSDPYEYAL